MTNSTIPVCFLVQFELLYRLIPKACFRSLLKITNLRVKPLFINFSEPRSSSCNVTHEFDQRPIIRPEEGEFAEVVQAPGYEDRTFELAVWSKDIRHAGQTSSNLFSTLRYLDVALEGNPVTPKSDDRHCNHRGAVKNGKNHSPLTCCIVQRKAKRNAAKRVGAPVPFRIVQLHTTVDPVAPQASVPGAHMAVCNPIYENQGQRCAIANQDDGANKTTVFQKRHRDVEPEDRPTQHFRDIIDNRCDLIHLRRTLCNSLSLIHI